MTIKSVQPKISKDHIPPFSVEVPGYAAIDGETIPRRNPNCIDKLRERPAEHITTIFDILQHSAENYGNAKALGSRKLIKTHNESKKINKLVDGAQQQVTKQWTYFELGGYEYISFHEFRKLALQIGAGFRKLGLKNEDRIHIFAATSSYWLATAHGAASQSMPIVTAYDTLGEKGLEHSLKATRAKAIFLDPHLLKTLINPLKVATDIQHVIWNSQKEGNPEDIEALRKAHQHLTIISLEELRILGEDNPVAPVRPNPDDLCCIMYTSGSTGPPKGVPIKHKAVVAAVAGVGVIVDQYIGPGDGLLAYLPLAHILEFVFENAVLYWGGTLGYGNPKTLADSSVRNCKGDIREFQPTILVGVPAIWESVKKGIITKVNSSNFVTKNLFWSALWAKNMMLQYDIPGVEVLDTVVFQKIRDATGGRLKICLNGGGPVAKETQRFISMAITPMINGYGLTETCAMGALMDPQEWTDEALGNIPGSVEIKLVDYEEAGYRAANRPNPQGEIWIRGVPVMEGYYENEEETKKVITEDGWFMTGDIGEWDHNGHLKIIDRKKNLVKTLNGEYIALEKLESIYRSATVVANICVYADPNRTKPIAIIVPAEPALKKLAQRIGVEGNGLEELVDNPKIQQTVLTELQQAGKAGGLTGIEIIEGAVLADEEWTPQSGLITSAQKLNRRAILEKYKKEVADAYAKNT
ncbi:BgTH12-04111 [Blumeria graminis f. sp. triticale]|uniref:Bgt-1139 n=3 Tax=Blumeria graminis TaxID=34373 RepID=A0A381L4Q2_BLUGR|nr:Long chain fatty acyl-CoA synthetase [Blumeria graminis f. sp. tritici 96224]CAD6500006.1 BgTH12-04111 [Blumeria graminis f. sp. triticale]VCU40185.1 Bgt-1139 [Blumeria graminis f. sp. tritici]